jgi:hypothetical protein
VHFILPALCISFLFSCLPSGFHPIQSFIPPTVLSPTFEEKKSLHHHFHLLFQVPPGYVQNVGINPNGMNGAGRYFFPPNLLPDVDSLNDPRYRNITLKLIADKKARFSLAPLHSNP